MSQSIFLFSMGLLLLVVGGRCLVVGAEGLARRLHLPDTATTIVAFIGTAYPVVILSSTAAVLGKSAIAYSSVVGSLICCITLITSICALWKPGSVQVKSMKMPAIFFFSSVALYCTTAYLLREFPRWVGLVMVGIFVVFVILSQRFDLTLPDTVAAGQRGIPRTLPAELLLLGGGGSLAAVGAKLLAEHGYSTASVLGVPEIVLGLILVPIGLFVPSLTAAIVKKDPIALSIGNIIRTNVFILTLAFGVAVSLAPFEVPMGRLMLGRNASLLLDIPVMLAAMILLVIPTLIRKKLSRWQGIVLLCIYITFCIFQWGGLASDSVYTEYSTTVLEQLNTCLKEVRFLISPASHYDTAVRDAFNASAVLQNPYIVSKDEQTMAHVAMMEMDADGTMWVSYYANETTTAESNTDPNTYCVIVHFNPYTYEELGRTRFAVGDSIGDYTQTTVPPYDPVVTVMEDKVVVQFCSYVNGERAIGCFDVDKATLEKSNYCTNTLTYNGERYPLTCSNLKSVYEVYSGNPIGDITMITFSTHFPQYNGEYYGVVNDLFDNSGYRSFLLKSADCVNWSIVHCFTEIPPTNEASICIKDDVVFMADRNNGYLTTFSLTTGKVRHAQIPLVSRCKMCVYNYKGAVYLATNILSQYDPSKEGYRKNMGIFKVSDSLTFELQTKILTQSGIHYPDLCSDGNDLFLVWSEDRRHLDRRVQRSDIGFARILVQ